jgi:hypothetical protein
MHRNVLTGYLKIQHILSSEAGEIVFFIVLWDYCELLFMLTRKALFTVNAKKRHQHSAWNGGMVHDIGTFGILNLILK